MPELILGLFAFALTMALSYLIMVDSDADRARYRTLRDMVEEIGAANMSIKESYKEELSKDVPMGKVDRWFIGLGEDDRDFIVDRVLNKEEDNWKAPMYRAAVNNGLTASLTTFKEFLDRLSIRPNMMDDYTL